MATQTQNSISSLLAQFLVLENNSLEIISKLSDIATSSADSITFNLLQNDGTTKQLAIPSFGYMNQKINRIDNNVQSLAGIGNSSSVVNLPDGTTATIFQSTILRDPTPIPALQVPSTFNIQNNWFFEGFLNPLLYVSFDVTGLVPDNMRQASMKRFIANVQSPADQNYFDATFKGMNNIDYVDFLTKMNAAGIATFIDEEIVNLPISVIRYRGSFNVLQIFDQNVNITSNNTTITVKKRNYVLNSITYTDILSGIVNSKTIQINDNLITNDGSVYVVDSIDASANTVILRRIQGNQAIGIGVSVLDIQSSAYSSKQIQINVGFNERTVIFLKPIDYNFEVAASQYSPGIGLWTNELSINLPTGVQTLDVFYKSQVTDFGQVFINAAKEKIIPAVLGEIPNAPILDPTNFVVLQINSYTSDTVDIDDIKTKLATKVSLENEILQDEAAISSKKNDLNNTTSLTSAARILQIKSDLAALIADKASKVSLFSSIVKQISTETQTNPSILDTPVYRARGFWAIPSPQASTSTQDQEVIQFRISYRKIRTDGTAPGTEQMQFTDVDGSTKTGYFSNWFEYKSDIRQRIYNPITGFYEWDIEDVTNADVTNINQLDVDISKNEQVQLRIKSISEAGYPINAQESDWSNIITIPFPAALQLTTDVSVLLSDSALASARVDFQNELDSRGLDLHLQDSFTTGDTYYAHIPADITSGFTNADGSIINLFQKLTQLSNDLIALQALVLQAKGALAVYLLDQSGNVTNITQNSTTSISGGFYKDLITSGSGTSITYNHGQIITLSYILRIENSAATPLELGSLLQGGLSIGANPSNPNGPTYNVSPDYDKNRRYDVVPISLTGASNVSSGTIKQVAPFQSQQSQALWIYSREKTVGFDADLYLTDANFYSGTNPIPPSSTYNFQGTNVSGVNIPINGHHLLPFDPTFTSTYNADPNVWSGPVTSNVPAGGGPLSEFCIHVTHPDIITLNTQTGFSNNFNIPPLVSDSNGGYVMQYPKFIHAAYFSDDATTVNGQKQLQVPIYTGGIYGAIPVTSATAAAPDYTMIPAKLGFAANDAFLIGKYTCGAYLYIAPIDYSNIAVDGSTNIATTTLAYGEAAGINIPLIFQFRCSDILGYIGGFRQGGNITNIAYTKKMGIDIQVFGGSLFSFDVQLTCQYQQDSLITPVYVPNVSLNRLTAIRNS